MLLHYNINDVSTYINWTYFFHAWGFPARFSNVAHVHDCPSCRAQWLVSYSNEDRSRAKEALRLYDEAKTLLSHLDSKVETHAIVEIFEANGHDEDIIIYNRNKELGSESKAEDSDCEDTTIVPMLRQQQGESCMCLADFLLPKESHRRDKIAIFATSVDEISDKWQVAENERSEAEFKARQKGDGYLKMLLQTLADRLAEATAEKMHEVVRKHIWGYAKDENLTAEEMFQEKYVGRRPAVGYPSLPDQSLNFIIDQLIDFKRIGIRLTETGAMRPHASTSGLIIAHPKACQFSIGHIGDDQLAEYAKRRGFTKTRMRQFLTCNLQT